MFGAKRGDALLKQYQSGRADPNLVALIDGRKAEGVTDEDFRRWYNLSDAAQKRALETMQVFKVAMYLAEKERTGDEAAAIAYALRNYPCYGPPEAGPGELPHVGEDRPLPIELSWRVDAWFIKNGIKPGTKAKLDAAMAQHATINSFIRAEMKAGRL
ncbi:MAG: hypothetical protein ACYDD7_18615 [Acidimicrobiales bacterium]